MYPPHVPDWPVDVPYDELPAWMRYARRPVDWPLVAVLALCAALLWPLALHDGLPWSLGAQQQATYALEISESIQSGNLYPRWAADFNAGYGTPTWNYFAPLPHYLAGLHRVLAQTSAAYSVKFVLAGGVILLGVGVFGFARRQWGAYAGLLAALLVLLSPQIALVKPYLTADLPGILAGACFAAALWTLDRALSTGQGWDLLLAAGACAGLWLAHTPLNLILGAIVLGWLLLRALVPRHGREFGTRGLLAYTLGFMSTAFYWLPAWVERDAITWHALDPATVTPRASIPLRDLLGQPARLDLSAINPAPPDALGVPVWMFALFTLVLALLVVVRRLYAAGSSRRFRAALWLSAQQIDVVYFAAAGGALAFGTLPGTEPLWALVPDWPPLEPPDLLLPAAICLTLAAGWLGHALERHARGAAGALGMAGCIALIVLAALPTLARPASERLSDVPGAAAIVEASVYGAAQPERTAGWLLPADVDALPEAAPALVASYQSGQIDKVARENLAVTTQVDVIEHTPQTDRFVVRTAEPATITLRTLMFPGWRAQIDEQRAAITPSEPGGLIQVTVPAGSHELTLHFSPTSTRGVAWALSGLAFVVLLGLAIRQEYGAGAPHSSAHPAVSHRVATGAGAEIAVVAAALLAAVVSAILPPLAADHLAQESAPGVVADAALPLPRAFQGGLDLLAVEPPEDAAYAPSDALALTLYWRASRPDMPDYQVEVSLLDPEQPDAPILLARHRHPAAIPTSQWPQWPLLTRYIRDAYHVALPDALPAGTYQLVVRIGRCSQLGPAPCESIVPQFVQDGRGTSLGQAVTLPFEVRIEA